MKQGSIHGGGCTENCIKLRIDAKDRSAPNAQDNVITNAYGDKFLKFFLLDSEVLNSALPYYQSGLGNRLCYEFMFNDFTIELSHHQK